MKDKYHHSECYENVCTPETGPKHFDKLKSEPGSTYNSVSLTPCQKQ